MNYYNLFGKYLYFTFGCLAFIFQIPIVASQQNATIPSSFEKSCPEIYEKKIICYMTNWAQWRKDRITFSPEIIDPYLCTHIVYIYAHLNESTHLIQFSDTWTDVNQQGMLRLTNLKMMNPNLKVMIALGGWTESGTSKYSELVANPVKRSAFNTHAKNFLIVNNLDGLTLYWEFPTFPHLKQGNSADRPNFALWVAELKAVLGCKLILSSVVAAYPHIAVEAYDPSIYKHLDWVDVSAFNFHGHWFNYTWYAAPLYSDAQVRYSADASIQYYIRHGCPPEKIVLGISTTGRSFTLDDPQKNGIGESASKPGLPGPYTQEAGLLAYYEFIEQNWTIVRNGIFGSYAYRGNQWITIDDPEMVKLKAEYVQQNNLGGIYFYHIDMDTFQPTNGSMYGSFKLVQAAKKLLIPPVNATTNDKADDSKSQMSLILFTSIPLAILTLLACIGIAVGFFVYKRNIGSLKEQLRQLTKTEIEDFLYGNQNIDPNDLNASIQSAPFDRKYELTEKQLVVAHDKVLGSGQYGLVLMGSVGSDNGLLYANEVMQVAVKTAKPDVDVMYFKALLSEVKIMAFLGAHDNVVSLIGAQTNKIGHRVIFIAIEYCANGDLLGVLKKSRTNFNNLLSTTAVKKVKSNVYLTESSEVEGTNFEEINSISLEHKSGRDTVQIEINVMETSALEDNKEGTSFSSLTLIEWSRQISNGMSYLSSKKIIHGDLAARNILLNSNNVAKISDFGLSRQLLNYSNYTKTTSAPLPWRWMAVESLKEMNFSLQSDVWSFGVVMWEIFTLGELPYAGLNWDLEFASRLTEGLLRLHAPQYSDKQIYDLMLECWRIEPSQRINMEQMSRQLHQLILKMTSSGLNTNGSYEICI